MRKYYSALNFKRSDIHFIVFLESVVSPELRQKLEIVEKCIATALRNNNLESVVEFHKKDILLLESAGVTPHKLQISLRNSFQFALWRFLTEKNIL